MKFPDYNSYYKKIRENSHRNKLDSADLFNKYGLRSIAIIIILIASYKSINIEELIYVNLYLFPFAFIVFFFTQNKYVALMSNLHRQDGKINILHWNIGGKLLVIPLLFMILIII